MKNHLILLIFLLAVGNIFTSCTCTDDGCGPSKYEIFEAYAVIDSITFVTVTVTSWDSYEETRVYFSAFPVNEANYTKTFFSYSEGRRYISHREVVNPDCVLQNKISVGDTLSLEFRILVVGTATPIMRRFLDFPDCFGG